MHQRGEIARLHRSMGAWEHRSGCSSHAHMAFLTQEDASLRLIPITHK